LHPQEKKKDTKRLTSIEMKCFRTEGYTLFDDKNNEDVSQKLKVEPVDENLGKYKSNWLHLTRMNKKDTKNNIELWTKWTKTAWKTLKDTSIKPQ
jgi:hypothetical protein